MGHALPSSEVLTAGTSPPTPQERRFFPRCCWDVHVCLGGGTSSRLLPTCSRPRCASLCSVSDPQEAQLDAEVCSVSDAREEVLCVTGSAGRHAGSICHRVIVDVFGQDAAALQQDSATGDGLGVSTTTVSRHACVCVGGALLRRVGRHAPVGEADVDVWRGGLWVGDAVRMDPAEGQRLILVQLETTHPHRRSHHHHYVVNMATKRCHHGGHSCHSDAQQGPLPAC